MVERYGLGERRGGNGDRGEEGGKVREKDGGNDERERGRHTACIARCALAHGCTVCRMRDSRRRRRE